MFGILYPVLVPARRVNLGRTKDESAASCLVSAVAFGTCRRIYCFCFPPLTSPSPTLSSSPRPRLFLIVKYVHDLGDDT